MNGNRTIAWSLGLAVWTAMSILPASLLVAQPAQVPAAKAPPAKVAPTDDKNVTWKLAGREGECAPLDIISKRGPAYGDIKSPKDLADRLKANGHQAEIKEYKAGTRPAAEVRAPSAGLHVMFVRQEHCDKKPPLLPAK